MQSNKQTTFSRMLKISANSNPKTVAGAISHTSRQGESPSMLATGASSINQAIKALAIARGFLEENKIDINAYPEIRPDNRNGIMFHLTKTTRRTNPVEKDIQQMKVSKSSKPPSVAGAIANKLRDGQRVSILAIGADSVLHSVQAIAMGRKFLEQDGLDISFRPEFTKVQFDESEERIAIKFTVVAQQI
jgi:stage V sporulation protein S